MGKALKLCRSLNRIFYFLMLLPLCLSGCWVNSVADKGHSDSGSAIEVAWSNLPQIECAAFNDINTAWFVTYREGSLLRTEDGGSSWDKVSSREVGRFNKVSFIDSHRGWAINKINGQGWVWRTTDGGRTWTAITKLISDDPEWDFTSAVQIQFVDELNGWIIETFTIWRTEDGGMNWNQVFSTSDPRVKGQPVRGFFVNPLKGWVCGTKNEVYRTADGGKTWHIQIIGESAYLSDIFFVDENTGWLSRSIDGQLYRTDDSGETWRPLPKPGEGIYIESSYFLSKKEGWGVGRRLLAGSSGFMPRDIEHNLVRGIVLRTLDGGQSWQQVQVGENDPFFDRVYFADAQHGWVLARDNVYRTNDGGKTWRVVLRLPSNRPQVKVSPNTTN